MPLDIRAFALDMISKNPNIANNPNAQEMINAIKNGDDAKGAQIADNILKTNGLTREQGISQAFSGFGFGK